MNSGVDEDFQRTCTDHNYKLCDKIGSGKYGSVYRVFSEKYQSHFAIKRMLSQNKAGDDKNHELNLIMELHHPNIIKIYNYWNDGPYLYIIMNYCANGSLEMYLKDHGAVTEELLSRWARQLFAALSYCHNKGITHNDIKPANIMLDKYDRAVLADFGLGRLSKDGKITGFIGTPLTMAPEVIDDVGEYDAKAADIWSIGMTLLILALGRLPFEYSSLSDIRNSASRVSEAFPPTFSDKLTSLLSSMLKVEPSERPTARELEAAPFVSGSDFMRLNSVTKARKSSSMFSFAALQIFAKKRDLQLDHSTSHQMLITNQNQTGHNYLQKQIKAPKENCPISRLKTKI